MDAAEPCCGLARTRFGMTGSQNALMGKTGGKAPAPHPCHSPRENKKALHHKGFRPEDQRPGGQKRAPDRADDTHPRHSHSVQQNITTTYRQTADSRHRTPVTRIPQDLI
jgi:hypothetical protein